jgi:Domain of unknown function (DUF932)
MNASTALSFASQTSAFQQALPVDVIRRNAPAVFAQSAHQCTSAKYTFIPTERVLTGLMDAGFVPVQASQARSRLPGREHHARHVVRLRRRFETIELKDSIPEIVFLNSHDGTSAYQLRMGIFRVVCTNGLIVSRAALPACYVAHRGNIVEEVVAAALRLSEQFKELAASIDQMEQRLLEPAEQIRFAERALALRYPDIGASGMQPSQLLTCRREEDDASDLWRVYNRVQENLLRGGLSRRAVTGRLTRTRRITSIREDVRLNSALWDAATELLAA